VYFYLQLQELDLNAIITKLKFPYSGEGTGYVSKGWFMIFHLGI